MVKKLLIYIFLQIISLYYYLCGNFSKQNIIFTKEFLNNENSLIFTAKKRVSFSEDGGQDSGHFNNRRADSGHFFGTSGHFLFVCTT